MVQEIKRVGRKMVKSVFEYRSIKIKLTISIVIMLVHMHKTFIGKIKIFEKSEEMKYQLSLKHKKVKGYIK